VALNAFRNDWILTEGVANCGVNDFIKRLDMNSTEVVSDYKLHSTMGNFVPSRLHLRLGGVVDDYTPPLELAPKPKYEAILVHEQCHYFQTSMTAYGHKVWQLYREQISFIITEWIRLTQSVPNQKRIPLGYLGKFNNNYLVEAVVLNWTCSEMSTLLSCRNYVDPIVKYINQLSLNLIKDPWQINPIITVNRNPYSLQGRDILESHALFLEGTYSSIVNKIPFHKTIDPAHLPKHYYYAFHWFLQEVGEKRVFEFPIICDLALQSIWNGIPKTEEQWKDSHPAWRFVSLVNALKKSSFPPLKDPKDAIRRYLEYCNNILTDCNYVSLERVLDEVISWYEKPELMQLEQRMKQALSFRKENLFSGANPFLDIKTWIKMKEVIFPPSFQIGGEARTPISGQFVESGNTLVIENILELHLQALAYQILGFQSPSCTNSHQLQCGYGYFNIEKNCEYLTSGRCSTCFNPRNGSPIPLEISSDDEIRDCSFEVALLSAKIKIRDIDVDFTSELPNKDELKAIESNLKISGLPVF
jgi:hypothetical protein